MREYIDQNWTKNAARLTQQARILVLVEGESDKKLYKHLLGFLEGCYVQTITEATKNEQSVSGGKKQAVIAFLRDLSPETHSLDIIAIIDADFDHLDPDHAAQLPNLFRTDTHDLETLILKSLALDKILNEFGSEEKLEEHKGDFREVLLRLGKPLGYLLWISLREDLGLSFEGLEFGKFIDDRKLTLNEADMVKTVKNKSSPQAKAKIPDLSQLQDKIQAYNQDHYDPWQVCCGHHLVEILALALQKAIGTHNAKAVDPETVLDRALRLAYESAYFRESKLYSALQAWHQRSKLPQF
ncbi:MAG: DUF4435 domain-containing protein [Prochlorothrix sp.]